ncbi:MAG TPA: zinc-dependent alcohol dehydrogenase family protein [Haliangiales bacterium]|nr:zinc-dependent alcohol dehydrogenase family protein [Haliangiales bacterium]
MRACRLHRPGPVAERPLAVEDAPDPTPGLDEVLVTVAMCGICRTDLHVVEGELPSRRSPVIPGHQVVGTVVARGAGADAPPVGARVGVAWLHRTCGVCRYCRAGRENLCPNAAFTGWSVDGGYAELVTAPAAFVHLIPDGYADRDAAPLLCAGIIGYRALRLAGIADWRGARLGLYGFGAAGHIAIQIARARGADVYVCTRDRAKHRALAEELGAAWVGGPLDPPPVALDAAIVFAPAGEIVPAALAATDKGGTVVLGGIHMSDVPPLRYELLHGERVVRSVANNTRDDARAFLAEAVRAGVRTHVETFPLDRANDALYALAHDGIRGAGVLAV